MTIGDIWPRVATL